VKDPFTVLSGMDAVTINAIADALEDGGLGRRVCWALLPRGAVVATAVLAAAYRCNGPMDGGSLVNITPVLLASFHVPLPYINLDPFGDYSPGRWAWLLTDVQRLPEPVPAKGKQGWWFWEPPAREAA
jgi:hypothetical protein